MVCFDDIDDWEPRLTAVLRPHVPTTICERIRAVGPKFIEDAQDLLLGTTARQSIIRAALTWLGSTEVAGYHGTRLTEVETEDIRAEGPLPLRAQMRAHRLTRALSAHPLWPKAVKCLQETLDCYGCGGLGGIREGQVHLTLSRAGLTQGFSQYLAFGSEFDQQVAQELLGAGGRALLALDGAAVVVTVAVPGVDALKAAHPFVDIDEVIRRGDVPNLAGDFLASWAYRQADSHFQCRRLELDCGMIFHSAVPAAWIKNIDPHCVSLDRRDS